eukprot:6203332-Pleurochrysis_carterae.AAC.2
MQRWEGVRAPRLLRVVRPHERVLKARAEECGRVARARVVDRSHLHTRTRNADEVAHPSSSLSWRRLSSVQRMCERVIELLDKSRIRAYGALCTGRSQLATSRRRRPCAARPSPARRMCERPCSRRRASR